MPKAIELGILWDQLVAMNVKSIKCCLFKKMMMKLQVKQQRIPMKKKTKIHKNGALLKKNLRKKLKKNKKKKKIPMNYLLKHKKKKKKKQKRKQWKKIYKLKKSLKPWSM